MNQPHLQRFDDERLLAPITRTSRSFYWAVLFLALVLAISWFMFGRQSIIGLGITGMNQQICWGFYIVNFVFFIGISHAGTLISAILRMTKAEWRRPITRMAEVITVIVLGIGALHPLFDIGRPDRVFNMFTSGRLQSPLLWDMTSISAYFMASTVYLFIPLIPDIAVLRDRGVKPRWLYSFLAWGWQGTERQKKVIERAMHIMMIMVIPIAVSVHTVISYIFAMTVQPGWHSTIFGPYFVVGAIFSGIAALMVVMIGLRKVFSLERYLKEIHFQHLGTLLLVMSLLWFYFTFSEYVTAIYGNEPSEMRVMIYKLHGPYWPAFWGMVACNFLIPVSLLSFRRTKTIRGILITSCAVIVGMWLERLNIVVPSLANPRMLAESAVYIPKPVEWSIFAGGIAAFILGFVLFSKFFPLVCIWELQEGRTEALRESTERVRSYLPDPEGEDQYRE